LIDEYDKCLRETEGDLNKQAGFERDLNSAEALH